jgi:hypothetical protein
MGHWAWLKGLISWNDFRRCERISNVIEKDYQLKVAMGFSADVFTRIYQLLRPRHRIEQKNRASRQGMT